MIGVRKAIASGASASVFLLAVSLSLTADFAITDSSGGTVINVTTTNESDSDGECALREAISAANKNQGVGTCPAGTGDDIIQVPAGIYQLSLAGTDEDANDAGDLDILGDVTIVGAGIGETVIDGLGLDRVFHIPVGPVVSMTDLTIGGGEAPPGHAGGGILNFGSLHLSQVEVVANRARLDGGISNRGALTIEDSFVEGNESTGGTAGGIGINNGSSATIERTGIEGNQSTGSSSGGNAGGVNIFVANSVSIIDSQIENNLVAGSAGGVSIIGSNVSIIDSAITGNDAGASGGGMFVSAGSMVSIMQSFVGGNTAQDFAGGVGVSGTADMSITQSTINGNEAGSGTGDRGGGLYTAGAATVTVTDSTISNNSAWQGGGIAHWSSEGVILANTTVSGNEALEYGGGILVDSGGGVASPHNATITNNRADSDGNASGQGGGVAVGNGEVIMTNTILAENSDPNGEPDCVGTLISNGYNLIGADSPGCILLGDTATNIVGEGPMLGPLQDNGGSTTTHALMAGSPALDAALDCPPPSTDQRGISRPQGPLCDIGAFEMEVATPTPSPTATPTPTSTPTPTPTPTASPTPTPSPTPGPELVQGDNDCDGDTDAVDALKGLQHVAAIEFEQEDGCPEVGGAVPAGEPPDVFGDVDCDGDVDAVDALKILQFVAAIPFTQNEPCVDVGDAF